MSALARPTSEPAMAAIGLGLAAGPPRTERYRRLRLDVAAPAARNRRGLRQYLALGRPGRPPPPSISTIARSPASLPTGSSSQAASEPLTTSVALPFRQSLDDVADRDRLDRCALLHDETGLDARRADCRSAMTIAATVTMSEARGADRSRRCRPQALTRETHHSSAATGDHRLGSASWPGRPRDQAWEMQNLLQLRRHGISLQ